MLTGGRSLGISRPAMRSAGAVRIDHAMGLKRLFWIPAGFDAAGGGYIRYPLGAMVDGLAALSQDIARW